MTIQKDTVLFLFFLLFFLLFAALLWQEDTSEFSERP